jgi:RNA polymerase sigma-70 factor (ECF subfamily)
MPPPERISSPFTSDQLEASIPAMRRYARALTGSTDRADDLVQDAIERALNKKALWRPTGPLKPWLMTLMLNIFRNQYRARSRQQNEPLDAIDVEPSIPAPQPGRLALAEVARALDLLEGTPYTEAARILDIPSGTLMSRLSRARASLKKLTGGTQEPRLRAIK